jgi:hypothetical protein
VCQRRFHHFNLWSERKRIEKPRYMHRNLMKRGLLLEPEHWQWSSYRSYAYHEQGRVEINQCPNAVMKVRAVAWLESQGHTADTHPCTRRVAHPFAQFATGWGFSNPNAMRFSR